MTKKNRNAKLGRPRREPGYTYRLRDVPKGAWRKFRAACRRQGVTVRAALVRMIEEQGECP
jgi:hypothetical protein